jgi:hypothetical protein
VAASSLSGRTGRVSRFKSGSSLGCWLSASRLIQQHHREFEAAGDRRAGVSGSGWGCSPCGAWWMWGLVGGWRLSSSFGLGRLAAQGEAPPGSPRLIGSGGQAGGQGFQLLQRQRLDLGGGGVAQGAAAAVEEAAVKP